jgi:1-acyl-sn-glycerol-3-phosphate acyltransferase
MESPASSQAKIQNSLWRYCLSLLIIALTVLTLLVWHPLLVGSFYVSRKFHRLLVALGNGLLLFHLKLAGVRIKADSELSLPLDRPLIVISNHQSFYDIPLHIWELRKHFPRFVAKKELRTGFPSASFVLRANASALIDRSSSEIAIEEIKKLGALIKAQNGTACIFPEGTRAKDGQMRRFKKAGIAALIESCPEALIVPVAIDGTWKILAKSMWPIEPGIKIRYKILAPLNPADFSSIQELVEVVQRRIQHALL